MRVIRSVIGVAAPERRRAWPLWLAGLGLVPVAVAYNDFDLPPHDYWTRPLADPLTLLLEAGGGDLGPARDRELVEQMLDGLGISPDSQVLVFSKTSLQRRAVGPENPRAIYFNDDVYLGWMPGGRIEVASFDPAAGPVFYFEDVREPGPEQPATFDRPDSCIQCHAGSATNFLPGPLARSVATDTGGRARGDYGEFELVSHAVPIEDRWGGWYVTGDRALATHRANRPGDARSNGGGAGVADPGSEAGAGGTGGPGRFFDPDKFPRPGSDALPMLVFDHQIGVHYRLVNAHYRLRYEADEAGVAPDLSGELPADLARSVRDEAERVVQSLLFCGEVPLPGGAEALEGDPAFRAAFAEGARRDAQGRSLRDLSLDGRLFANRCSYMVYSNAFEGLPAGFRAAVLERLHEVLSGSREAGGRTEAPYGHLPAAERRAIAEIVAATVPDLPECWGTGASAEVR